MATDLRKISALPPADTLDGTELVPIVQGGITKRTTARSIVNDGIPPGFVMPYMGLLTPTGWLDCDVSSLSKTTFLPLWTALHAVKGTVTVTIATPAVFTLNAHGLETGDRVYLTTAGALPTGLASDTTYYLIKIDANTFNLATSMANALAGTKINTSGSQSGTHTLVYAPHGVASATNFLLPDGAEAAFVGVGTRGSGVTAHDTYTLGRFGDDQLMGHHHDSEGWSSGSGGSGVNFLTVANGSGVMATTVKNVGNPKTDGSNGPPRTGTTTHGKQVGVRWMIHY